MALPRALRVTEGRERRAFEVFRAALGLDGSSRSTYLDVECAADPALRSEVDTLLRAHGDMGAFLDRTAADTVARAAATRVPEIPAGAQLGAFTIVRRVGGGASGAVYEAAQDRPSRRVAVKVLRAGFTGAAARRRFLDEADLLARLDHPGVARVFAAGLHTVEDTEVPWLALEFVDDGLPITVHAEERWLDRDARVRLVVEICDAVGHAHQKGVLHRDLKPANVLVDSAGRVKVIDFGIAVDLGAGRRGEPAGTLAYMSPEQSDPAGRDLDVRSDVYSLGVILHELLTGLLPLAAAGSGHGASTPPGARLGRELSAIVGKATAPRREDRYSAVSALRDDLCRHLDRFPVDAVGGGAAYHMTQFARREPVLASALATVVAVCCLAAVVGARLAIEKERERSASERQAYVASVAAGAEALSRSDVVSARAHLLRAPAALRNWEWHHLASRLDTSESTLRWEGQWLRTGAITADGTRVVVSAQPVHAGRASGKLRCWDLGSGAVVWDLECGVRRVDALAFSRDGEMLAAGYHDGGIELRRSADGGVERTLEGHGDPSHPLGERHVNDASFLGNGAELLTCSGDGTLVVWDVASGARVRTLDAEGLRVICLSVLPGEAHVAAGRIDGAVVVFDLATGEIVQRISRAHGDEVAGDPSIDGIAVSPDGTRLATASRDGTARLWRLPEGALIATSSLHGDTVRDVAFSPNGEVFALASWDRTLSVHRALDGRPLARMRGHADYVERVAFLPQGDRLVSFSHDGTVRTWRMDGDHDAPRLGGYSGAVASVAVAADGLLVVGCSWEGSEPGRVWDLRTRQPVGSGTYRANSPGDALAWPDGSRFLVAHRRRGVEVWSLPQGAPLPSPAGAFGPAALRRDGAVVFATDDSATRIRGWRTDTWGPTIAWDSAGEVVALALTHDGKTVASASLDGAVALWDAGTGRQLARRVVTDGTVRQLAFDPAGGRIAVADMDPVPRLFDALTLEPAGSLDGHAASVLSVAFSPDGTRIATASQDASVRLWDAATLEPVLVLDTRPDPAWSVAFADRGRTLIAGTGVGGARGAIVVWSAQDDRE